MHEKTETASTDPGAISILFSEGSSLTARQALSALGPLGYRIDVCDPDGICLSRFSRFVHRFYRSPALGADPVAYLRFIRGLLATGRYDVLLPVHEQAFLFSRVQRSLQSKVGLALTEFENFAQLQSKASFARVFDKLGIPQPTTRFVRSRADLEAESAFPYYVKLPYSTAGKGVWRVEDAAQRLAVIHELQTRGCLDGRTELVIQAAVAGIQCQAIAIFERGSLVALQCVSQRAVGVGNSLSARLSVDHPIVRTHTARLGQHLQWHGALTLDYFVDPATGGAVYYEANPRITEAMNSVQSGLNLADMLVRLSLGESFRGNGVEAGAAGTRTHCLLSTLLGLGVRNASRRQIAREVLQAALGRGVYSQSKEELTPIRLDPLSLVPLAGAILAMLVRPGAAHRLSRRAVTSYSLTPKAVSTICELEDRSDSLENGTGSGRRSLERPAP